MTMEKLTTAQRTAQVNAWKLIQYEDNKDDIEAYWDAHCGKMEVCRIQHRKQHYQNNKTTINAKAKRYHQDNIITIKTRKKQYYQDNKITIIAKAKQYYKDNRIAVAARTKQYQRDHPQEKRTYVTNSAQCAQLNNWFPHCQRHHVDANTIIHVPEGMHVANRHNLRTGKGMDVINALAFEYLFTSR